MRKNKSSNAKELISAPLLVGFIFLFQACDQKGEREISYPQEKASAGKGEAHMRPHVPVPSLGEYGWLRKANILLGRESEIASVKKNIEDYYSGYPSFLKVLKLITRDRNVGLKDNPAYLTDVFSKYYELVGADERDPFLAVSEYNAGVLRNALFLSWKKQNEFSPVDNYDDCVTSVSFGE